MGAGVGGEHQVQPPPNKAITRPGTVQVQPLQCAAASLHCLVNGLVLWKAAYGSSQETGPAIEGAAQNYQNH